MILLYADGKPTSIHLRSLLIRLYATHVCWRSCHTRTAHKVWSRSRSSGLWRHVVLHMQHSSKTLVITGRHNQEDNKRDLHCRGNSTSHVI